MLKIDAWALQPSLHLLELIFCFRINNQFLGNAQDWFLGFTAQPTLAFLVSSLSKAPSIISPSQCPFCFGNIIYEATNHFWGTFSNIICEAIRMLQI